MFEMQSEFCAPIHFRGTVWEFGRPTLLMGLPRKKFCLVHSARGYLHHGIKKSAENFSGEPLMVAQKPYRQNSAFGERWRNGWVAVDVVGTNRCRI
jgi:hypothetical protein